MSIYDNKTTNEDLRVENIFFKAILLLCLGRLLNIKPIEVFHLMSYMIRKPQTNIYKGKFVF
jgi:hypothetical protein